jgi:hypothetical protein
METRVSGARGLRLHLESNLDLDRYPKGQARNSDHGSRRFPVNSKNVSEQFRGTVSDLGLVHELARSRQKRRQSHNPVDSIQRSQVLPCNAQYVQSGQARGAPTCLRVEVYAKSTENTWLMAHGGKHAGYEQEVTGQYSGDVGTEGFRSRRKLNAKLPHSTLRAGGAPGANRHKIDLVPDIHAAATCCPGARNGVDTSIRH